MHDELPKKNKRVNVDFIRESIKNLRTTGTIARSSKYLCQAMIEPINFAEAKCLVELGAGDGVITEYILENMRPDARLLAFEVNEVFCEKLRDIKDKRLVVIKDSAEYIGKYLKQHDCAFADYIVSAIPFVMLPDDLAVTIVEQAKKHLRMSGLFIQFHYSLMVKKMYLKIFEEVSVKFEPRNIPPAFILICKKINR